MKAAIEVEKLVQWTIREELPKGRPVSADIGFAIGRRPIRPGSIARSFGRAQPIHIAPTGYVPGEPCADARRVAVAIGNLDTEVRLANRSEALRLFGEFASIAGDAVTAILSSTFNPQAIVVNNAAQGKRPNWRFDRPKPHQRFVPTAGRPRPLVYGIDATGDLVELKRNEGRARKRDGEYTSALLPRSPLEWCNPFPLAIAEARAEYVAWYRAMSTLALGLTGKLDAFEPMRPTVKAMPWLGVPTIDSHSSTAVRGYLGVRSSNAIEITAT
ncbi:hypothetical protein M2189_001720 [Bradyrhizobium japonicum]|uniref:hypothetical protein n=1 Tax=Bradyrhizobium japonicum TaxID=375 RepID=UPI00216A8D33|nr:hypothetical protein [Bradyrhizobium japonicum]MCS3499319.1 hypothetical protein [Bradyrhizobium japonicum]MCS3958517.1 hypothetical protein [Bradyrhizobium japonicum]MCS4000271.1 hypothetical protein [Bradyrhizobium japonicum]